MLDFRFGFLCCLSSAMLSGGDAWRRLEATLKAVPCEGFTLWVHPETRVFVMPRTEGHVVVLGDAYRAPRASLHDLLAKVPWDDPWPELDAVCGRYAILFLSGGSMRAAHDAFGSRSLFYRPGHSAVASHAVLLGLAFDLPAAEESLAFLERPEYEARTTKYLPGDLTTVRGVYALAPNNHYDGTRTLRHWPRAPRRTSTTAVFHEAARAYFDAFVPFVLGRWRPVFGVTGGIDSRAAFAPFLGDFRGISWTNHLPQAERPIVAEVVAHLGIKHRYVRPVRYAPGDVARAAAINGGGLRPGPRLSEALAALCRPRNVFVWGFGGEILRGFSSYGKRVSDLSPRTMTRAYSSSVRKCALSTVYLTFCEEAFEAYGERANHSELAQFGFEPMDHFYWEHRMGIWGATTLSEMDAAVCGLVGFNGRQLFATAFGLPAEERLSKKLLAGVVALYDARLAALSYT